MGRTSANGLLWHGRPGPRSRKKGRRTRQAAEAATRDTAEPAVRAGDSPCRVFWQAECAVVLNFSGRRRGATPHEQTAARCHSDVSVGEGRSTTSPAQRSRRDASRSGAGVGIGRPSPIQVQPTGPVTPGACRRPKPQARERAAELSNVKPQPGSVQLPGRAPFPAHGGLRYQEPRQWDARPFRGTGFVQKPEPARLSSRRAKAGGAPSW